MNKVAQSLMELRIASRAVSSNKSGSGSIITLRTKVLFLLSDKPASPPELLERLCMVKSNLALLCNRMVKSGAIEKLRDSNDKRVIYYRITEDGLRELNSCLSEIEERFCRILKTDKDYDAAENAFRAVLDILSFL